MDRLAEIMNMDPWEFRRRNMREKNDPGPLNQRILVTDGLSKYGRHWIAPNCGKNIRVPRQILLCRRGSNAESEQPSPCMVQGWVTAFRTLPEAACP